MLTTDEETIGVWNIEVTDISQLNGAVADYFYVLIASASRIKGIRSLTVQVPGNWKDKDVNNLITSLMEIEVNAVDTDGFFARGILLDGFGFNSCNAEITFIFNEMFADCVYLCAQKGRENKVDSKEPVEMDLFNIAYVLAQKAKEDHENHLRFYSKRI